MIFALTRQEAEALFTRGKLARLGCLADGEPYVVPVRYAVDGLTAVMHSLPGRKIDAMRASPRVCLQIDELRSEYHWRSVQAFGAYEEITDNGEAERAADLLYARFPRLTPADSVRRYGRGGEQPILFKIRIDRIVGVGEG